MKQIYLSIYSPEDGRVDEMVLKDNRDQDIAALVLLYDAMELGAWFKVERKS